MAKLRLWLRNNRADVIGVVLFVALLAVVPPEWRIPVTAAWLIYFTRPY